MTIFSLEYPLWVWGLLSFLIGAAAGTWINSLVDRFSLEPETDSHRCSHRFSTWHYIPLIGWAFRSGRCPKCGFMRNTSQVTMEIATGLLFAGFATSYFWLNCQQIPEVQPDRFWYEMRAVYQLVLLIALATAVGTDLRDYIIPGEVTFFGIIIGAASATLAGQLQLIHLWVDWNVPQVEIYGQYVPAWIDQHRHLHGFAYSLAGIAVGGGITWAARILARLVLGQEALGFGDVILMGMIGAFIGWQPVTIVFLLAPFCGLVAAAPLSLLSNKPYVPYGPFLALSTVVVLFSWKWIWMTEPMPGIALRYVFGDAWALATITAISLVAFVATLSLVRLYRMIPGKQRNADENESGI